MYYFQLLHRKPLIILYIMHSSSCFIHYRNPFLTRVNVCYIGQNYLKVNCKRLTTDNIQEHKKVELTTCRWLTRLLTDSLRVARPLSDEAIFLQETPNCKRSRKITCFPLGFNLDINRNITFHRFSSFLAHLTWFAKTSLCNHDLSVVIVICRLFSWLQFWAEL